MAGLALQTPPALAQLEDANIVFSAPPPPPDKGTPGGRAAGGAGRGACTNYEALQALMPTVNGVVYSQTAEAFPTFWFYLPTALEAGMSLELVIQDANDEFVYITEIANLPIEAGLIRISVPSTATPLEIEQLYTWTFSVQCDRATAGVIFVNGTIERVPAIAVATDPPTLEQASHLAKAGLWHEALTEVAEVYQQDVTNSEVTTAWETLLEQGNVPQIALEDGQAF